MLRPGQVRPVIELFGLVVPEPRLARLEAPHERMPGVLRVLAGVLLGRGVAAADVSALRTPSQVHPPAAGRVALDAARPARRHRRVDSWHGHDEASCGETNGMRTENVVAPGTDATDRSPWCRLTTIRHEMSSPSPVPEPTGLVVKNGSKIRPRTSSAMPGPVSPICTSSQSSSRAVRMVSVPCPAIASTALSIRLVHTWFSSAAYTGTGGSVLSYSFTTVMPSPIFDLSISNVL